MSQRSTAAATSSWGATLAELKMNKAALPLPTYPRYDLLLSPDPTLVEELSVMQDFRYATPTVRPPTTTASASAGWPPVANSSSTSPRRSSATSD